MSDYTPQYIPQSNIPNPDPSVITDREIAKAKADLRHEFDLLISGLKESINTRIEAIDKASVVLSENVNRVPTLLDREIATIKGWTIERFAGLEGLVNEKFSGMDIKFESIATQFAERDVRAENSELSMKEAATAQALSGTTAVNAALQAQKESAFATQQSNAEAIRKSEAGFQDRIKALEMQIQSNKDSAETRIADVRRQLDRGEGVDRGSKDMRAEGHATIGSMTGIIAAALVGISLLVAAVVFVVGSNKNGNGYSQQPAAIAVAPIAPSALAPR